MKNITISRILVGALSFLYAPAPQPLPQVNAPEVQNRVFALLDLEAQTPQDDFPEKMENAFDGVPYQEIKQILIGYATEQIRGEKMPDHELVRKIKKALSCLEHYRLIYRDSAPSYSLPCHDTNVRVECSHDNNFVIYPERRKFIIKVCKTRYPVLQTVIGELGSGIGQPPRSTEFPDGFRILEECSGPIVVRGNTMATPCDEAIPVAAPARRRSTRTMEQRDIKLLGPDNYVLFEVGIFSSVAMEDFVQRVAHRLAGWDARVHAVSLSSSAE